MMRKTILLTAACLVALAACGADDEDSAGVAEAPVNSAASERAAAAQAFPIAFPEGGTMITDGREGGGGHVTIRYPADRHGEIVDFYDNYTKESGSWNRSEAGQGDVPSVNFLNLQQGWNISVAPPAGEQMLVTLTAS